MRSPADSPLRAASTLQAIDRHFARVAARDHVPGIAYAVASAVRRRPDPTRARASAR